MGRPLGARNKMHADRDSKVQSWVRQYGSPVVACLRMLERHQHRLNELLEMSPSSRRKRQIKEEEMMILAITERVAKFCHPQYRSITQQVESKNLHAVVRAPEMTSDHQAWIDKYRPKEITGAPTAPASPALKALAVASEVAERVGVSNDDIIRKRGDPTRRERAGHRRRRF